MALSYAAFDYDDSLAQVGGDSVADAQVHGGEQVDIGGTTYTVREIVHDLENNKVKLIVTENP